VNLTKHDGTPEAVLFAANLASEGSQLAPLDAEELKQQFQGSRVEIIPSDKLLTVQGEDARAEWWIFLLAGLGIVLGTEQALAWLFGRRR
jgi:hypothetical protein